MDWQVSDVTQEVSMSSSQIPSSDRDMDVAGCTPGSSGTALGSAKSLPKTFAEKPDGEAPRAPNRMRSVWNQCLHCQRWYAVAAKELNKGKQVHCSVACAGERAAATGRFAGKNNPRWLGGVSNDNMRYRRRQLEREPVKEAARRAVTAAIARGDLIRQPCEKCDAEPGHGHHDDYSKPLDVRWLCRPCHVAHHTAERRAVGGKR